MNFASHFCISTCMHGDYCACLKEASLPLAVYNHWTGLDQWTGLVDWHFLH